jgi:elongation factor G
MSFAEPVIEVALEPRSSADQDKLAEALPRMLAEDPSLHASVDETTGRTVLGGMGMLHLEVFCQKLDEERGIAVTMGKPAVAYKETVTAESRVDYKHSKQTGGPGQFARIVLAIAPAARGSGLKFVDETRGGAIDAPFVVAVEKGVRRSAERGFVSGHPLVDVTVRLVDGAMHAQDSSAVAFETCAALAMRQLVSSARPTMIEPVMALEIVVPEAFAGAVVGDLAQQRGSVRQIVGRGRSSTVFGEAPLRCLFGYVGDLRSRTEGRGSATMKLSRYELLPKDVETALRSNV